MAIALLMLGIWAYRILGSTKHPFARQSLRFAAIGIGSLSLFPLLFIGCGIMITTHSQLIYSPNHRFAVRVSDYDLGGIGGDTAVDVYSNHGIKSERVLFGLWKVVEVADVHWLSDSEVLIQYPTNTGYDAPTCKNFGEIKVTCVPAGASIH